MEESVLNFNSQLSYQPEIINEDKLGKEKKQYKNFILCGMGGSHLQAGILKMWKPGINIYVHRDYDLPPYSEEFLKESLLIASSYSGNTEEVVSFLEMGISKGLNMSVITTGGKLLEKAEEFNLPHIIIPSTGIQPRSALGYSSIALSKIVGEFDDFSKDMNELDEYLDTSEIKLNGEELAKEISGKIPVIYSSKKNLNIAYNWKIKMNETGKVPAFYNIFPELNHNEMQGFGESFKSDDFHLILIKDQDDHPRIQKRMNILQRLYEERGYSVTSLDLIGNSLLHKIFSSLILADWISINLAKERNIDPEEVPMIEEFKVDLSS